MSTFKRFVDHMMYRLGYTRQEQVPETSSGDRKSLRTAEPALEDERLAVEKSAFERAAVTEAVAKRMKVSVGGGVPSGRRSTEEEKHEMNPPPRTGNERTGGERVPDIEAHGQAHGYVDGPRPRLQFQQIWPEQQVAAPEKERYGKVRRDGFFNALKEARTNLWVAEFKELPRNAFGSSGAVSDGTSGRETEDVPGYGPETGSRVPIWEINPQIAEDVPESIARVFSQETGFSDQHRLVILLSKNLDMERVRDISRHLAETNVQKVLMGGPEMLELMVSYPADILDDCAQITFLVDNADMSAHEKATLSVIQRRIQQETSIPVNLECYGSRNGWSESSPVRSGEVHPGEVAQNNRNLPRTIRPALPEPEAPNIWPEMKNTAPPPVPAPSPVETRQKADMGVHPGDGYSGERRYLPGQRPDFRDGGGVTPGFSPGPALAAAYTPPKRGNAERQPPTEKQIVHARNMLERLGFNTETINERYRKLNVPIGWVGRPVSEFLSRLDRKAISFLIDTLKQLERAHMMERESLGQQRGGFSRTVPSAAVAPQAPSMPPGVRESGGQSPAKAEMPVEMVERGSVPGRAPVPGDGLPEQSVPSPAVTGPAVAGPAVTAVAGVNAAHTAANVTVPANMVANTVEGDTAAYPAVENRYRYENSTSAYEGSTAHGGDGMVDGQSGGTTFAPQPERTPERPLPIRPFPSGPMR